MVSAGDVDMDVRVVPRCSVELAQDAKQSSVRWCGFELKSSANPILLLVEVGRALRNSCAALLRLLGS